MARLKKRWLWLGALVVVVLVLLILGNLGRGPAGIEVKTRTVSRKALASWVRAPGTLEAVTQVKVSSNLPGRIEKLFVEEGDWTEKGLPLLSLDDIKYQSAVDRIRAELESAEALRLRAETERSLAESNFRRKRALLDDGLVPAEDFEQAKSEYDVADAALRSREKDVERQKALLRAAERDLDETRILAPVTGLVTRILVEEGENVVTGTMNNPGTIILEMADLSEMEVEAEVDETDVVSVAEGQPARIEVDAFPDTTFLGRVRRVGQSGRVSEEGADFLVRVRVDGSPPNLRPGMTADVEILVATVENALAVPIQALTVRPREEVGGEPGAAASEDTPEAPEDGTDLDRWLRRGTGTGDEMIEGVFIVEGGEAAFRSVQTGLRGETEIEIVDGLAGGETVITGPYSVLRSLKTETAVRPEGEEDSEEETEPES